MADAPTIRAFVAISLSQQVIRQLKQQCVELKKQLPSTVVRWLPPQNWHITLKFLGNLTTFQLQQLSNELERRLGAVQAFQIQLTSIDWFPNHKRPSVLAAIAVASPQLNRLAELIEQAALQCDLPRENKIFRAHFSLARCRRKPNIQSAALLPVTFSLVTLPVNHIQLMRSQTFPSGAVYSKLASFPLLS